MKKKILVVVQNISKAQEHEWFVEYLNRDLFEIHYLLINGKDTFMDHFLLQKKVSVFYLNYKNKSELLLLTLRIYRLLRAENYQIIHTHLFEATMAGLTAAWFARVPGRIYTRHHSDFHHVRHPSAVKFDKYNNFLATAIVAISKNVKNILMDLEHVSESKIHLIHHGIDLSDYNPGVVSVDRVGQLRAKYHLEDVGPVIGAISRFIELKGMQYLIPAFSDLLLQFPNAVLVLANAGGSYKNEIYKLLEKLNPNNYRLIEFENDVAALYKTFDCFVHIPVDLTAEAFGQTYLESLASMIPSVFTLSGVAPEFIVDKQNALVVPYRDTSAVREAVLYLLENKEAAELMSKNGYEVVKNNFDIQIKINKLEKLYAMY